MSVSIFERLTTLSEGLKARLGFASSRTPAEQLNKAAEVGGEVLSILSTPGMNAIRIEQDAIDIAMLEEVASDKVSSWEQYVELRGRLWGFRKHQNLANELVRAGAQAEKTLEASRPARSSNRV